MNLIECKVLEIYSQEPYKNGGFIAHFKYTSYGRESTCKTWVEDELKVGKIILM